MPCHLAYSSSKHIIWRPAQQIRNMKLHFNAFIEWNEGDVKKKLHIFAGDADGILALLTKGVEFENGRQFGRKIGHII